ncbi:PrgI family protein [Actinoplanes subglobosus]|uniref:PrgI family protein n=1 Tax=Actinoplanes subglobosus TaxID=1547892 RepID=A0ABV8J8Q3_9ACTN
MNPKKNFDDEPYRARIPADVSAPDTIAWGLSFRQLAILGTVAGAGWLAYSHFRPWLPGPVWLALLVPAAAVTVVVVLGRRDGLPLDVWLRHGLTMARTPRRQTPGTPDTTAPLLDIPVPKPPALLRSPVTTIAADGTLTVDGTGRRVIACGTTDIALRTGAEQQALLDGFGSWLNALTGPAQIVVAAQRHDLTPYADTIRTGLDRLPHPALRAAAQEHAAFLLGLDADRDPLRRQVLTVVADGPARDATVRAFGALSVTAAPLDGGQVTAALAAAADPFQPPVPGPRAVPDIPITLKETT